MTRSQRWVLALMSAAALMVALDGLVVATALTTIQRDLHASLETLEWTVNAYSLSFAVLLMTGSALGDRYGRRRVLLVGIGLFIASSAACALAPSVGVLVAARTVQGAGSALVMPVAMALLTAAFPPERRGWALGTFSALTGLAVVCGPIVGGAVTEGLAWQWIFWLNVPIGLTAIPLVFARIEESYGPRRRLDAGGLLLATGACLGLVWGLIRANTAGWSSGEVVSTLLGGAVLLFAFVAWELRAAEPMLPMRYFRSTAFAVGNTAAFLLYATLISSVFFLAQYLQVGLGFSPLGAGLRLSPWTVAVLIVAPVSGRFSDRVGPRRLLAGGLLLQAAGLAWVALNAAAGRGYGASVAALVIAGCGVTMAMPAAQSAVLGAVPPSDLGKASGIFNTLRQLGGVFGIAVLAAAFAARGSYASAAAFTDGLAPAIGVAAGMSLVGAMIGLATPGRQGETVTPTAVIADGNAELTSVGASDHV
jgi:EmrB/QacA subfamily drug resistance transporter